MKSILRLLSLVKNYKGLIALNVISNILTAVFTILTLPIAIPMFRLFFNEDAPENLSNAPAFSFQNLDEIMQYHLVNWIQSAPTKHDALLQVCVLLITSFFLKNLFQYLSLFFLAPVRNGVIRDLRQQLYHKINLLPLTFFTEERKGDLISRMSSDVHEIEWSILSTLEKLVRDPLIIIGAIGFMLTVSVKLTLFVLGMLVFTGLIIGGISTQLKKQSGEVQTSLGRMLSILEETLGGSKVIKAFTAEGIVEKRFSEENNLFTRLQTRLFRRKDIASPLSEVLGIVAVCFLFVYGANMVFSGQIASEVFLTYLFAFFYTIAPSKAVAAAYYNVQKGLGAYERIENILEYENPILTNQGSQKCLPLAERIEINDVSFAYHKDLPLVLKNISMKIEKGETIALVGSSGSGKSTLTDLLMRFYDVSSGTILFDGVPLQSFELNSLRKSFGVVTQEPILFNTTVAENISFGSGVVEESAIIEAAKLAQAHDFIVEMPNGYQSNVGDSGQKLSGGQRQRIALARAILADPSVLILDEATSALDSESEQAVQRAMVEVLKNRTAIVIAHRLSTIQHADHIMVLKDGQIIESGSHHELLDHNGEYQKFVELQRM